MLTLTASAQQRQKYEFMRNLPVYADSLLADDSALVDSLELPVPEVRSPEDIDILKTSVNPDRLKNHPVKLTVETIESLYKQILRQE